MHHILSMLKQSQCTDLKELELLDEQKNCSKISQALFNS